MRAFTPFPRFTEGLVTDRRGVKGALLEADNVIPREGGSYWQTRGAKLVRFPVGASTNPFTGSDGTGTHFAYPGDGLAASVDGAGNGVLLMGPDGSNNPLCAGWSLAVNGVQLNQRILNAAGSAESFGAANYLSGRGAHVRFGQELWIPPRWSAGASFLPSRWAGSVTASYTTGTVSGTSGSRTLTGSGTSWTAAQVGAYIFLETGDATEDRLFRIVQRNSTTEIVVDMPIQVTFAGVSHRIMPLGWWSVKPGVFGGGTSAAPTAVSAKSYLNARSAFQHSGRVLALSPIENDGKWNPLRVRWSAALAESDGQWSGAESWHENAYLDLPAVGGDELLAGQSFNGTAYVFKESAVIAIRGALETDGRDVGASVSVVSYETGLLGGEPVVTPIGILFGGPEGLMLVNDSGVRNLCAEGGVQSLFREMFNSVTGLSSAIGSAGSLYALSYTGDRVVLHGSNEAQDAYNDEAPNVLVWYPEEGRSGIWCTQTTIRSSATVNAFVGGKTEVAIGNDGSEQGLVVPWYHDHPGAAGTVNYGTELTGEPVLMRMSTHPLPLRGGVNGRVRAVQARARLVDPDTTNPTLALEVLLGEQGRASAVEAAIAAEGSVAESTVTEKWHRLALRDGSPPVDQVRVRVEQTATSNNCRLYELGVEHVSVARLRP